MLDQPPAVMMFAAGFGTRMKHLTQEQPKPMIPVAGRPMIDHTLDLVQQADVGRIVANLHYKPIGLKAHLEARGVTCVLEAPDVLETGGGLRNALPQLGSSPVFTVNTDAIWVGPNPLTSLLQAWDPVRMEALLVGIPPERAIGHHSQGDFTLQPNGQLVRGPGLIYGGVQIIKTERLATIQQSAFSLNVIWDQMLASGGLFGLRYSGQWCDVGHPDAITLAERLLEANDV